MSRPNRGSVEPHRGRYRVRTTVGGKRKTLATFDTKAEAERFRKAWFAEVASGAVHAPGDVTFRLFGEEWFARREIGGKVRGIRQEQGVWRRHVLSAEWVDWPLEAIRPSTLQDWIGELERKPAVSAIRTKEGIRYRPRGRCLGPQTIRHAVRLVRGCFKDALLRELVDGDPTAVLKLPSLRTAEEGWTFLSDKEIDQLLTSSAVPEDKRLLFEVAIFTGMRRGELFALQWEDVDGLDGDRPRLAIRRGVSGAPKSGRVRRCPLLPAATRALRRWRELSGRSIGLVFPNPDGKRFGEGYVAGWADVADRGKIREGWKTKAGIDRPVRFHDLRHTCASHLLMGT